MSLLIEEQNAEYLKNLLQFVREMRLRYDSIASLRVWQRPNGCACSLSLEECR